MTEQLTINNELGPQHDDCEIDVDLSDIQLEPWDDEEVSKLFTSLEFKSLYERLRELDVTPASAAAATELELQETTKLVTAPTEPAAVAWDSTMRWLATSAEPGRAAVVSFDEGLSTMK